MTFMDNNIKIFIVPHTHWDREWYMPFEQFRFRLIWLVDKLINILDSDPKFEHFMFDGQTIVLEDYLSVKPYNKDKLKKYIKESRIIIGPWYVLPDEFLVSGEAIIRNLLYGFELTREFGGHAQIGYLPDMFGHISQMPQILNGFNIDNAFLWRGIAGIKSEFIWEAPDGSSVFAVHFPDKYGYANGCDLSMDAEEARAQLMDVIAHMRPYNTTSNYLIMNGVDHMEPNALLPSMIEELNRLEGRDIAVQASLESYLDAVKQCHLDLDTVRGELRDVDRVSGTQYFDFILAGVLSSRVYLKQLNYRAQLLMERWAEPWSAIAWLQGEDYPYEFIKLAWKYIIKNHPHDDICGCSTDDVHKNNVIQFEWAKQVGDQIIEDSFILYVLI